MRLIKLAGGIVNTTPLDWDGNKAAIVGDKNLAPKTWCRFPILSGGFERELAELRAVAR